jgi:hypothetical protein
MRGFAFVVLATLAIACGDDSDTDTGADDDGSSSMSATMSGSGSESDDSASMSASNSASASNSGSASESDSGSSDGSATNPTSDGSTNATTEGSTAADSSGSSGSESGGLCSAAKESCANGEMCCEGLTCCEGVPVPPGQEYCEVGCPDSDRNIKRDFAAVDRAAILAKVAALPVTTWNYTFEDPGIRHIGPMAQDFAASFAVGATDKAIAKVDADGVALAAIQALHHETTELRAENDALRDRLTKLESVMIGS